MAELSTARAVALVQEVADAVEVLLDMAVFLGRIHHNEDDEAFPEHARYLLAMRSLSEGLGLQVARTSSGDGPVADPT